MTMSKIEPATRRRKLPLRPGDLPGLSRLAVDAVVGVTDIVEAMHRTIASVPAITGQARPERTSGLTGLIYRAVRGTTRTVGQGLDALWAALPLDARSSGPERDAFVAALNGVWGDHLADTTNPLAIPMTLRIGGQPYRQALPAQVTAKVLVLVHGLAMNDRQWQRHGHDHGQQLARDLGFTPVYLHYNTGRHISVNGREFADRLDELVADWPVPVEQLVILCHSMGGLVTRSACRFGKGRRWRQALSSIVFLGTPHHGAPLERGGRLVDTLLGISAYAAPLARLGKSRSAGITDLRYGNLHDEDWQQRDRHAQRHDDRQATPLPRGVKCFVVAATTSAQASGLRSATLGDGLVPLASALGDHADPRLALKVPNSRRMVVTSANHWDVLDRDDVYEQVRTWLS